MAIKIVAVGRTGDGKSAFCNLVSRNLGSAAPPFLESAGAGSHTHQPLGHTSQDVTVFDTPGLMDTGGVAQDEVNIRVMVEVARAERSVSAFFLTVSEGSPRFDDGMQNAVKLLADSFGPPMLARLGIVFTNAIGRRSKEQAVRTAAEITALISGRAGVPLSHLPCWQVDCHPEELGSLGVPSEVITARAAMTDAAVVELLRWARANHPLDTSDAVIGEYEQRRIARESALAAQAASREAAIQRQAAEAAQRQAAVQRQAAEQARRAQEAAQRLHSWESLKHQPGQTRSVVVHGDHTFVGGGNQSGSWRADVQPHVQAFVGHIHIMAVRGGMYIIGGPSQDFATQVAPGVGVPLVQVHDGGSKWHSVQCAWDGQGVVYSAASGGWGCGGDGCTKHARTLVVDIVLDAQYGVPRPTL